VQIWLDEVVCDAVVASAPRVAPMHRRPHRRGDEEKDDERGTSRAPRAV
jgi:hypothetical protein